MERHIEHIINLCGTQADPAPHLIAIDYTRSTAHNCGIDLTLNLQRSMADFYMLERLEADGSRKASKALFHLESTLAPKLSRYMVMICGGELRHAIMENEEEGSNPLSCGCCCSACHETNYQDGDCLRRYPSESPYDSGDDWTSYVAPVLQPFVSGQSSGGRDDAWQSFMQYYDREPRDVLKGMVDNFYSDCPAWRGGGYGGSSWGDIANLAYDYQANGLKARHFINMAWSLQHNGGSMFNKLWSHDHLTGLHRMLNYQADDDYNYLSAFADVSTRALWRVRDVHRFKMLEHDEVWLGRQIVDKEVEW